MRTCPLIVLALAASAAACKSDDQGGGKATTGGAAAGVKGAATLDGKALAIRECALKDGFDGVEVRLPTPEGVIVLADDELHWGKLDSPLKGPELSCTRLEKDYMSGKESGQMFWHGTLGFDCKVADRALAGDLTLECGTVSPEMRARLEQQKQELAGELDKMKDTAKDLAQGLEAIVGDGGAAVVPGDAGALAP